MRVKDETIITDADDEEAAQDGGEPNTHQMGVQLPDRQTTAGENPVSFRCLVKGAHHQHWRASGVCPVSCPLHDLHL